MVRERRAYAILLRLCPQNHQGMVRSPNDHRHSQAQTSGRKLGAKKLTPEEQKRRFIEAEQAAGASEDEAEFDANLKRIARTKAGLS